MRKLLYALITNITAAPTFAERFTASVTKAIVQFQYPLEAVTAVVVIWRIGYPLITWDEQDHRAVKKRILPIAAGVAAVAGAIYWANQVVSFMEF